MMDEAGKDLALMREDYKQGKLDIEDLNPDPILQFGKWFDQAVQCKLPEPNAMSLATVSEQGQPSLRTVLLKSYDHRGFVFFTNLQSRKATEITANPKVALLFPWIILERQVIITGIASRVTTAESLKYFLTRPRGSQLAAWISQQSRPISSRQVLEMEWAKMKEKFANGEVPLPSFWGGYRVKPSTIEFWQGRSSRLHDRFLYTSAAEGSWKIERLAP